MDEQRDMERVEVFVRDLFLKTCSRTRSPKLGIEESGCFHRSSRIEESGFHHQRRGNWRNARIREGCRARPEATPPPVAAQDATDATESSTECPPPAETCSVRGFGDGVSFWFEDDVSGWGSTASARPSRISPPGFPFPGRADVKTSNRARARNRVLNDDRVRQPNQAMRPLSVRVMSLSSEKREREDATTARSPEGNERAVGYEPVADGADGDAAVAEDRRDRAPAAEATRREDVGDAAEPRTTAMRRSRRGSRQKKKSSARYRARARVAAACASPRQVCRRRRERWANRRTNRPRVPVLQAAARPRWQQTNIEEYFAKVKRPPRDRARRVEAKAGGESRGESRGGLYGFAKKAHAFLVERAARRLGALLAALFLSRASRRRGRESTARMGKPNLPEDFA